MSLGAWTSLAGIHVEGSVGDFANKIIKLLKKTEHLEATIMAFITKLGPLLDSLCTYCGRHGHSQETCWVLHPELKSKGLSNSRPPQRDKGKEKVNPNKAKKVTFEDNGASSSDPYDNGDLHCLFPDDDGFEEAVDGTQCSVPQALLAVVKSNGERAVQAMATPWNDNCPSGINRSQLAIVGRTRLKVHVGSTKALLDFAVIEDGSVNFLISSPGLNHLGVAISYSTKTITCKYGDKVPFLQQAPTDDTVRLEHELTMQLWTGVTINALFSGMEVGQIGVFEPNPSHLCRQLMGPSLLVTLAQHGARTSLPVVLENWTGQPVVLPAGFAVGKFYKTSDAVIATLNATPDDMLKQRCETVVEEAATSNEKQPSINEEQNPISTTGFYDPLRPFTDTKLNEAISKTSWILTWQQQQQLKALLQRNRDVFAPFLFIPAKSKCPLFWIDTEDAPPVKQRPF
ncbi:hypothetical protein QOT17_020382 [Balamuthia mandrillaris]